MNSTSIITHDGTCLLYDPDIGVVSGRNRAEAEAEARRLARRTPPARPAHTYAREAGRQLGELNREAKSPQVENSKCRKLCDTNREAAA